MYLLSKSLHLLFVVAWMAAVFYLPRILVNIAEDGAAGAVRDRLVLMGRRLYRFGHVMFGLAVAFGLWLWFGPKASAAMPPVVVMPNIGWMHAKLTLVALLLAYFIWTGRMLKGVAAGATPRSGTWLRWFNELPIFALLAVIWLVLAKPF